MATVVPPPSKKQKTAQAAHAREQAEIDRIPSDLGSVRVQFVDAATGKPAGTVSVPVQEATVRNLEGVVNLVLGSDDRIPYTFTFRTPSAALDITSDLYTALLRPGHLSTEDVIPLHYTPQAVFRVRAVNRCAASIPGHGASILCTQFAPASSARMASGAGDGTARIWDCDTGTPLHTLAGHASWVLVVAFSPDGTRLATGSMDNTVRLWDPATGAAAGGPLTGHTKWIRALAWEPYHLGAPGDPRVASASKDSTVRLWHAATGRVAHVLSGHAGSVSCVRWGGTGRVYSSAQDKTIKIWDADRGTLVASLAAHAHWVNHLALSTDWALRTAYHDPATGTVPGSDAAKRDAARARFEAAARVDGQRVERLVSASDDLTIYLWQPPLEAPPAAKVKPLARLLGHQKTVNHVTFSPDGRTIASSAFDNAVKLWRARDGTFLATLRGHVGPVYMSCFSPDSRLLVSASKDTTLKVWDVQTGKMKEDLVGHRGEVFAVDWAPDGGRVGSGGADKSVRIWRH